MAFSFFKKSILIFPLIFCACAAPPPYPQNRIKWIKYLPQSIEQQKRALVMHNAFELYGKVAFRHGKRGGNASLAWQQKYDQFYIELTGPLGSGKVQIEGKPGHVAWRDSKGHYQVASNPEMLLDQLLGLKLPVAHLRYWIRGLTVPGISNYFQIDESGQVKTLKQAGWIIEYPEYRQVENHILPQTVILEHDNIRIKIIIKNWHLN